MIFFFNITSKLFTLFQFHFPGGRVGKTQEELNYFEDNSSGGETSRSREERSKKETKSLIQKQFELRKTAMITAKSLDMSPVAQLSRVKQAMSTTVKVNGLTIKGRESYLTHLTDSLKKNLEKCENLDNPEHNLVYKDLEDVAIELEYQAFTTNKVVSLYRRSIVKYLTAIKDATTNVTLFPELKSHKPKKRNAIGGEFKAMQADIKREFGDVLSKEVEELKSKTDRKRSNGLRRDYMSQTKINNFFQKNEKGESNTKCSNYEDNTNDDEDDDVIIQEKFIPTIELDVLENQQLCTEENEGNNSNENNTLYQKIVTDEKTVEYDISSIKIETEDNQNNVGNNTTPQIVTDGKNHKKDEIPVKFKPTDTKIRVLRDSIPQTSKEITKKDKRKLLSIFGDDSDEEKTMIIKKSKLNNINEVKISDTVKTKTKPSLHVDKPKEELTNKKKDFADLVIKYLMPYYREKKITSKDLFKSLARHISHELYSLNSGQYIYYSINNTCPYLFV